MNGPVLAYLVAVLRPEIRGWLKSYDVESHDGYGHVALTADRTQATRFADAGELFLAYNAVPKCRPVRHDGHANKPLTAYHAEAIQADDPSTPILARSFE